MSDSGSSPQALACELGEYHDLAAASLSIEGLIDQSEFARMLVDLIAANHRNEQLASDLVEFSHGPTTYLFDKESSLRAERTILAFGHPETPSADRDAAYQRGFPLAERRGERAVDRGHFIPYTAGGLFGPNLFVQDRALNRGWSREGRRYRALERAAVMQGARSLMFVHPHYIDDSDVPGFLTLGLVVGDHLEVDRFRNRYDQANHSELDPFAIELMGATDSQIGALGEETAALLLEGLGATIVSMGDAGLPRDEGRQDLDLLVIVDGSLVAIEVKTRHTSKSAGRLTRAGNLARPRLRRPGSPTGHRQGSQRYVAERLSAHLETGHDYDRIDVRVIVLDFHGMLAQQFTVDDSGTRLTPLSPPQDCADAARRAFNRIIDHRHYL